ncbi:MAG TPA: histidine triad nucleotide-binding protein [Gammaproteobacteria bacterium]|nr:histidine triad nucleotide-binding protein [Gammaproteobacteria bacterium]
MTDCLFCKIKDRSLPAEIVFENEELIAFKDIHPKARVHLLLIPKLHLNSLDDITPAHSELLAKLILAVPEIAKQQHLQGYRTIINTGANGGQIIFHLHLHILGGGPLPGFH